MSVSSIRSSVNVMFVIVRSHSSLSSASQSNEAANSTSQSPDKDLVGGDQLVGFEESSANAVDAMIAMARREGERWPCFHPHVWSFETCVDDIPTPPNARHGDRQILLRWSNANHTSLQLVDSNLQVAWFSGRVYRTWRSLLHYRVVQVPRAPQPSPVDQIANALMHVAPPIRMTHRPPHVANSTSASNASSLVAARNLAAMPDEFMAELRQKIHAREQRLQQNRQPEEVSIVAEHDVRSS